MTSIVMWHGAHRWEGPPEIRAQRQGSAEHGPGIYMTTSVDTARKYAKGGGSLIRFEVDRDLTLLEDVRLPVSEMAAFVKERPRLRHKKEILSDLERAHERMKGGPVHASVLNNLFVNYRVVTGEHGPELARFFVTHGIDASAVFHGLDDWLVLFNPTRIRSWKVVPAGKAEDAPRLR
jgi:hypothetical protein